MKLDTAITLVQLPALGRLTGPVEAMQEGTFLNLVNSTPDAAELYCVAWDEKVNWEGWLRKDEVQELSGPQRTHVPGRYRLPVNEVLKRTLLARAKEFWGPENPEQLTTLLVEQGDLLQVRTERNGWAYATTLKEVWQERESGMQKCRSSGWLPIYVLELVENKLTSIASAIEQESLSTSAVLEVKKAIGEARPEPLLFQETMPQVVEQSHRDESKAWEQKFKQEQEEQDGPSEEENAPQEEEPRPQLLELRELPEECCPLYVCKEDYIPQLPGRTNDEGVEHLLKLYKGDVVRVVSLIEDGQQWLQGYVDSMEQNKPRGWFPTAKVERLCPRGPGPLGQLLQGGTPELPKVPRQLRPSK
ncbi:Hypothetical protein (Fragment) [Durusdinium trenchii]|uniref:SH3 domain-containing protein n=1 Tax=Durusdinium trenchii TaxID=1381693 RepID=A0ABP0LEI6_9DINO